MSEPAIRQAIEDIEVEIENLRAIITDLRPSLLDDLGLQPAIEALASGAAKRASRSCRDPLPDSGEDGAARS